MNRCYSFDWNTRTLIKILMVYFLNLFFFQAKKLLGADEKQLGVRERLMAGSMAGVASQTSIYPLEVIWLTCNNLLHVLCHCYDKHAINKLKEVYHNQQGVLIATAKKTKPKSWNWHISFSIFLQQILKYELENEKLSINVNYASSLKAKSASVNLWFAFGNWKFLRLCVILPL